MIMSGLFLLRVLSLSQIVGRSRRTIEVYGIPLFGDNHFVNGGPP